LKKTIINKSDLLKFRLLTIGIVLFSFTPMFLCKIGFEYNSFSVTYSIFFIYSILITILSHIFVYGDFLLSNTKKDLLKHLKLSGNITNIPYFLLYLIICISIVYIGILLYSINNDLLIGVNIDKKLLSFFISFGLISLFLIQKNRLGKFAAHLVCRYY